MSNYIKDAKKIERAIKAHYQHHNVRIKVTECTVIPHLKRYIFTIKPSKGAKVGQIIDRAEDIQVALGLPLFYAYRDDVSIRLAVSEYKVKENKLLKILRNSLFSESDMAIPLALGYDITGNIYTADLAKQFHMMIVGPSGSGKSVALKCLILSILTGCHVETVRLIVFEIGSGSLSAFHNALHLYHPIVKDVQTGIVVLESLVAEMNHRDEIGEDACQSLPFLVCVIDEFDDTISNITEKEDATRFASALDSLIRKGRKAKIILVLASHNPTLKTTKVNVNLIESRIAFRCAKHHNSSAALGVPGAEKLEEKGAMLFKSDGKIMHLQGSWVTDEEIEQILHTTPSGYDDIEKLEIRKPETLHLPIVADGVVVDELVVDTADKELTAIIFWVIQHQKTSTHLIQQHFRVGKRASKIIDTLYVMGIITDKFAKQPRDVLVTCYEDLSEEVLGLFDKHGYTVEQIQEALNTKCAKQGGAGQ
ncbi:MAG: FtsK/SpoIIIE domain-containing protein [Defluviitaleaceae bacterium]|nr:FtsK/SpoIIIE domain-containing protein [Defluviitaleaceae bacterium]